MSAREMYDAMNMKPPKGKEKHHGNKRKGLANMKVKARRSDRHKEKRELIPEIINCNLEES